MRFLSFSRRLVRVDRGDELRRLEGEAKVEDNLPMVASPAAPRSHPHRFLAAATFVPVLLLSSCRTLERDPPVALGAIDQPTFALIDVDGDGRVSPSEMAKYKHAEGLAEIDLDNDKRVSLSEWKTVRPVSPSEEALFARLDLNRDGYLDESEAVAHITAQEGYRAAFQKMDANGDGHLHWEEYAAGDASSLNVTLVPAKPATGSLTTGPAAMGGTGN